MRAAESVSVPPPRHFDALRNDWAAGVQRLLLRVYEGGEGMVRVHANYDGSYMVTTDWHTDAACPIAEIQTPMVEVGPPKTGSTSGGDAGSGTSVR